jgi:O-antigen ligase
MTSTSVSLTAARGAIGLERAAFWLLLAFVGSLQVSIAAASILLTIAVTCWAVLLVRERRHVEAPKFYWALLAYAGITLVASALSLDPRTSLIDSKQLAVFLIVPMVYTLARGERAATVIDVIVSVGAVSAAIGIIEYGVLHYDNLGQRPQGFLSHYMTYSGLLMLVITTAVARLLFAQSRRTWSALVMPALIVALAVTLGRSAWIGTVAAVAVLLVMKNWRLIVLLPVLVGVLFVISPQTVSNRARSILDVNDPTNRDRLAMLDMGTRIIKDNPLVGIGPNMVPRVYARYRPDYAVNEINPHLHNVPVQIAAERGIPALCIWLAFIAVLVPGLLRLRAQPTARVTAAAALAAVTGMAAAGLFEYNFGDSEFLMLFLVIVTLPFAAAATRS